MVYNVSLPSEQKAVPYGYPGRLKEVVSRDDPLRGFRDIRSVLATRTSPGMGLIPILRLRLATEPTVGDGARV